MGSVPAADRKEYYSHYYKTHCVSLSLDMYNQDSLQENVIIMQQRRFPEILHQFWLLLGYSMPNA